MKVLREKEYHMLFSKMHLSPLFLERHLIETDRMRPQGICLLIDVRCFSEMKATFPAVFEKYLTGQAVHIPKVSACHFIFVEEFQKSIYKISGSGKAFFSPIQYTTPGIYYYTITQQSGTHKRGHYDQTVYYVKVSVTNGENGNLETVIAAHTDADMTDAKCDITFTNYYKPIKKTSESTTETIPTTKRKPETKPGNKTSIKKSKNKVKTGDNSNATLFAILLLVSGTGLLIIAISRYREKYHK